MTDLQPIKVNLSQGKKQTPPEAYRDNIEVIIRLSRNDLSGNDVLMVPSNTVKKLQKTMNRGKGMNVKISRSNIRRKEGSGIFSALMPVLKMVAPTIGKTLGLSALAGAASEGASQII